MPFDQENTPISRLFTTTPRTEVNKFINTSRLTPTHRQPLGPATIYPTNHHPAREQSNMTPYHPSRYPQYPPSGQNSQTPLMRVSNSYTTPSPLSDMPRPYLDSRHSYGAYSTPSRSEPSDCSEYERPTNEPTELCGIQPPAIFPGTLPIGYLRKEPIPPENADGDEDKRQRHGAPSCNPWDYLSNEEADALTAAKFGQEFRGKSRRRFTKRELEALEVLWSVAKSPTKYERQRLGHWLGVRTKHITVWFQNRRQEEKRHQKDGAVPPPPSRYNRGTYDPATGKWRPVPLSCISGLQPPPPGKVNFIKSIALGEMDPDSWRAKYPDVTGPQLPTPLQRAPLVRTQSGSLENILHARETGFGPTKRVFHGNEPYVLPEEEEARKRCLTDLMPSDPPSMDLAELQDSDEDTGSPRRRQTKLGHGRPQGNPLGRATSFDLVASSSRAKHLMHDPRSISDSHRPAKHSLPPVPTHRPSKRPKYTELHRFKSQDSCARDEDLPDHITPIHRSGSVSSQSSLALVTPDMASQRTLQIEPGQTSYSHTSEESSSAHEASPSKVSKGKAMKTGEAGEDDILSAANSLLAMLGNR